jgi:transcriptional regulator with XRE-family HTH domain
MSMKTWEKKVLAKPGAPARVAGIEDELRLAAGLILLREQAGLSQRDLAKRLGVSQPRIAKIERSKNVTVELLEQYVEALGGHLQVTVVKGNKRTTLISPTPRATATKSAQPAAKKTSAKKAVRRMPAKRARQPA